jgi:kynurenine formamidase
MASRGVRLVGIDYLSVAPFETRPGAHRLPQQQRRGARRIVRGVEPGLYELVCLPLLIEAPGPVPRPAARYRRRR